MQKKKKIDQPNLIYLTIKNIESKKFRFKIFIKISSKIDSYKKKSLSQTYRLYGSNLSSMYNV